MKLPSVDRVLIVLLGASLVFNVAQQGMPDWLQERLSPPKVSASSPLIGRQVQPSPVQTLDGNKTTIDYSGKPTILYIMSPTCTWCKANTPVVTDLAKQVGATYRFVGMSMTGSGLSAYLQAHPLPFPVYVIPNPFDEVWDVFSLGATPYMVAINGSGQIVGAWPGALAKNNRAAVLKFFQLKSLSRLGSTD